MADTTDRLSMRAYARHRGVSEAAVRKAAKRGKITVGDDGLIDPLAADRDWAANTRERPRTSATAEDGAQGEGSQPANPEGPGGTQLDRRIAQAVEAAAVSSETKAGAERRKEIAQANMRELLYREKAGDLVSRSAQQSALFKITRVTRDRFIGLVDRVGATLPREVRDKLDREIRSICAQLAQDLAELGGQAPADPEPEDVA